MPIYEYRCEECDHRLEKLQKMNDEPAKTCPECGVDSLRKLISAAVFKLKGTGWYETDFKDKKPKKEANNTKDNKTESKKSADSGSNKTETKSKDASKTSKSSSQSSSSSSSK